MTGFTDIKRTIKVCFSRMWDKQALIFLFFLCLSTVFWFFQALNESYEREFAIPVELRGVPKGVVVTTDLPEAVHVTLADRGIVLLDYAYGQDFTPIVIDFATYANATGHVVIPVSDVLKQISSQFSQGTRLVAARPDNLEFYYNYGLCRKVPVRLQGVYRPDETHSLTEIHLKPDSVLVYASRTLLDTITAAYVHPLNLTAMTDTVVQKAPFDHVRGAKFVPAETEVMLCVDRLVEKTVQVPVRQANFPATKQLRTFPTQVNVTFQVSMGMYRSITAANFTISLEYEELVASKSSSCRLALKSVPPGVSHVRIQPESVEYIIEEMPEGDFPETN